MHVRTYTYMYLLPVYLLFCCLALFDVSNYFDHVHTYSLEIGVIGDLITSYMYMLS